LHLTSHLISRSITRSVSVSVLARWRPYLYAPDERQLFRLSAHH